MDFETDFGATDDAVATTPSGLAAADGVAIARSGLEVTAASSSATARREADAAEVGAYASGAEWLSQSGTSSGGDACTPL